MSATPAVRRHLASLVNAERSRIATVLVRIRAIGSVLYFVVALWMSEVNGLPDWRRALVPLALFAAVSFVLLVVTVLKPETLRWSGYAVALLDIPLLTATSFASLSDMERPDLLIGSLAPFLGASVVLTGISLDRGAIAFSTVVAVISAVAMLLRLDAPMGEFAGPLFSLVLVGVGVLVLVSRLRSLVTESRRKDFGGKYVLGERLGTGGMAEVFSATYSPEGGFERRVAVKRVLPSRANDEEFISLFRREAEIGAQLAHPNLVQVLDFGRHLDSWFLAMEFVDGLALSSLLKDGATRQQRLPAAACLFVMSELAEVLAYLHERPSPDGTSVGLVHRDVNPPNVLIATSGDVKLSDFGVARWQGGARLTETGAVRGKVAYLSPEQARGAPPAVSSDIFAFGVTAYELLTGGRPFHGENEAAALDAILRAPIVPPTTVRPELPAIVDELVMGLLERDVDKRLASTRIISARLRALEGPDAPYPHGKRLLAEAVAAAGPSRPALVPTTSNSNDVNAATATLENVRVRAS